ncbi:MAG: molybdopterin-binding protein [Tissierellaceae bacterium]|nr:molybdopterin-binding protein [Tissierellaceae bacterium]
MLKKVSIIPTGNEIYNGVVIDTNSPAIMQIILENFPQCEITREKPVIDKENKIVEKIDKCVSKESDLIIIIGGSGGGFRFDSSLAEDYTHSAIISYLTEYTSREIYGKNGHLWSKIVYGRKDSTIVTNVPGPYVEALAAAKALVKSLKEDTEDSQSICEDMANAVISNYPSKEGIKCVRI